MKFSIIITILAVLSIILQTYRESLPNNRDLVKTAIQRLSAIIMIAVAILSLADTYSKAQSNKNDEALKNRVRILEKVDAWRIQILNNTYSIYPKYVTALSYANFAKADKELGTADFFTNKWFELVSSDQKQEVKDVDHAIIILKSIALEMLNLDETYPGAIPKQLIKWAFMTLKLDILTLEIYFDPYSPSEETLRYLDSIGTGFSLVKQFIRKNNTLPALPNTQPLAFCFGRQPKLVTFFTSDVITQCR